ncbi:CoA-binding protein [Pleomorphovibrio marinus]|uniref:CoA-binding protein n=1 Tax=Pleomorphovibrio marinus TaxID=2164132 RepID=UPI000E0BAED3|nr:CoA-binding protein [Pleomorphovibrio marinus]
MNGKKRTVIIGASPNPTRYAYTAAKMLHDNKVPFIPVGIKEGVVFGEKILDIRKKPQVEDVHTVTLYLGPKNQEEWVDYILSLSPQRLIFNPGTENTFLAEKAKAAGISVMPACTLVLLSSGQF